MIQSIGFSDKFRATPPSSDERRPGESAEGRRRAARPRMAAATRAYEAKQAEQDLHRGPARLLVAMIDQMGGARHSFVKGQFLALRV